MTYHETDRDTRILRTGQLTDLTQLARKQEGIFKKKTD